jgi:hypothetical protein
MAETVDLSVGNILKLNTKAQLQQEDLYSFLKKELPDIPVEDRLKYLSAILNDFFESYTFDKDDEFSIDGYIVKRFYPKGSLHAEDE